MDKRFWRALIDKQAASRISIPKILSFIFQETLEVEMDPIILIKKAKSLAEMTKYVPAMVYANLHLAQQQYEKNPAEAIALISEAKQLAKSNNRFREIKSIKQFVDKIGLDYETV